MAELHHIDEKTARTPGEPVAEKKSAPKPGAANPEAEPEAKAKTEGEQSEEPNKEGEARKEGEAETDEDGKPKEKPPPPPPHGDKTPWQVFTETLQSEFKASKEWNEGTKQLSAGYQEFTQNPTLQKAKSTYGKAAEAASTTTGAALKKTAGAIGSGAAWTWETPVVKVVRKGAVIAGSGIEKATRNVRQTEAFKSVKDTIDDGSSSRYGGWTEKEERRKKREAREAQELAKTGRKPDEGPVVEDPNAGVNVTLHKDAAWKEKWSEFRDNNRMMQGLFSLKSTYNESENPLITTARSISDSVAGFFAENETAKVIKKFREMDPSFHIEPFLQEMREYILPEVLDAYVKGDIAVLKLWLSTPQYQVYEALMKQYTTAGLKSDGRILDIRHVDILSARLLENDIPVFIITARTQEVHTYKNIKTKQLAAGMDDKVQQVTYAIGVTRIPEDVSNPETRGWRLIELQKSARDYI
ncbi:Tim44-domain-containing protein [Venturia nashicola]|nr:Tim44-domain-containing protein [Venturia nashicola]